MRSLLERTILKTIAYADVFDYPLKKEEIGKWLISIKNKKPAPTGRGGQITNNNIRKIKLIGAKNGYYFLKRREKIVGLRIEREKYSQTKLKIAQEIGSLLKLIPTVKLVGITGALSVNNAKKEDDIDLFIITSNRLLWTTRFLVTFFVELTGRRRHPQDKQVDDKICLNMFADENYLAIPKKEQDLFSAHEVLQMQPIFDRENTYHKFLIVNQWVRKYLPNAISIAVKTPQGWQAESHDSPEVKGLIKRFSNFFERFLKSFQLWYMKNRRTTEVIKEGMIRFHPQDARIWVMREYKKRLKYYLFAF